MKRDYSGTLIEHRTGWSIKQFVRTPRRYRTVQIEAGKQSLTAADPLPTDIREILTTLGSLDVHKIGPSGVLNQVNDTHTVYPGTDLTRPCATAANPPDDPATIPSLCPEP